MLKDGAELKILTSSKKIPSPALIIPLPANRFANKLAPKAPNNIPKNPPFLKELTIFTISFTSSFEIISVVMREAKSEGRPNPKFSYE